MNISKVSCNFQREPLVAPFGFKGGYLSELWQSVVRLENAAGEQGFGLGTQSTLWSDADVFTQHSESAGNSMMFAMTAFAAKHAQQLQWHTPMDLLDQLLEPTYEYGKSITGNQALRLTFALNALVAVDNAAWQLHCRSNQISHFDDMTPADTRPALANKHEKLACIPLLSYGIAIDDVRQTINDGYFVLKIKIGSDPEKNGDLEKMLAWDTQRLAEIHEVARDTGTPYTTNGHILYYLDANGRYDSKDRLMRFLDQADRMGALDRIILLEEPFAEEYKVDVSDLPVCVAADESAHSDKDALERIDLGYTAIALKPIAKTMSMSFKISKVAHERGIPCFCADLTVNPVMVDWNKNVAARLEALPGMKIGVIEANGAQNYRNWETMKAYHPSYPAPWIEPQQGVFTLQEDFYRRSGGIFEISDHYCALVCRD